MDEQREDKMAFFVAVHIGVGYHSEKYHEEKCRTIVRACRAAKKALQSGCNGLDAVVAAIRVLEDCPLTNAGLGSNLTKEGTVESDSSVMCGDGLFAAIGAAPGLKNPIQAAAALARQSSELLSCGRVRPIFLAGDGARKWALENGLQAANSPQELQTHNITDRARSKWEEYNRLVESAQEGLGIPDESARKKSRIGEVYDTVGCVLIDSKGLMFSGVSSGGIALKTSGRVGEASMFGAGCWAADSRNRSSSSVAASVSGVGEVVMVNQVAQSCCNAASASPYSPLNSIVKESIARAAGGAFPLSNVGIIAVRAAEGSAPGELLVEYSVGHSSQSMGFGCLGHNCPLTVNFLTRESIEEPVVLLSMGMKWTGMG